MLAVHGATGDIDPDGPATSLGYSGEHFDAKAQQQYLRARWYDPANGRFNRLDPFAGNMQGPQSLHKYAYVHGDPIGGVDPTGQFLIGALGGFAVGSKLRGVQSKAGLAAYTMAGAAIDFLVVEATRKIFRAMSLAVSPTRSLNQEEIAVLAWLHRNAGHKYSGGDVAGVLRDVRLFDGTQLGVSDWTSVWGAFADGAIDGLINPPAGAVTIEGDIYFAAIYDTAKPWVPSAGTAKNIGLLAHETTHSMQYNDSIARAYSFGIYYLTDTGVNGYKGSIPEIEGYAMQAAVQDTLLLHPSLVGDIVAGTPPATAAADLSAAYQRHESRLRNLYGR